MFNILLSIFVCAAASFFFAWVVSAHVSAPYVIAGSTRVVDLSLQTCSNVTLEDVALLGECCPSLNLLVLVFVSGTVSLSQVDVAFNVLDLTVVDIYWCVVFHQQSSTCLSSGTKIHFHQLIPVAFVVVHVVYYHIRVSHWQNEDG